MKYERNWDSLHLDGPTALSLGKFDGIHRGHGVLLELILGKKRQGMQAAVFTFDSPPQTLAGHGQPELITTNQEKQSVFEGYGIDALIECPFTEQFMHMEAEEFIRNLIERLQVRFLAVGSDFRFGWQRKGDCQLLRQCASRYGYALQVEEKLRYKGREISSTFIREELCAGHMELVNELLGYPYFIQGKVLHGNQIGRTIGFPTINLQPSGEKLLPPFGAYVSDIRLDGKCYHGITDIGRKPTIQGISNVGVETYIFDFNENIYGETVRVDILKFLRPEQKFQDVVALKEQLAQDMVLARKIHAEQISQKKGV